MTVFAERHSPSWRSVFATAWRILTFRASGEELMNLSYRHLAVGILFTWLVGMGRYYDNPRVGLLKHLGLGSIAYVFLFSLFLWLIIWPLRPGNWRYLRFCAFVSLVSPPAILYALPVERLFDLDTADTINILFLAIVATWRVALLIYFLKVASDLDWVSVLVAVLLPLSLVVVTLTTLNLEKAVFSIMGGLSEKTANDGAFAVLVILSLVSSVLFIPLLFIYLTLIVVRQVSAHRRRLNEDGG